MLLQKSKGHFDDRQWSKLAWRKKKKERDRDSLRASVNVDFLECTAVEPQTQSADFSLEQWRWRLSKTPWSLSKKHMAKNKYQQAKQKSIQFKTRKNCYVSNRPYLDNMYKIMTTLMLNNICLVLLVPHKIWNTWDQEVHILLFKVLLLATARYTDDCWLQVYESWWWNYNLFYINLGIVQNTCHS